MGNSELKSKTVTSLFWSFMDKFGEQALNLISMLILMNIVSTEAYGLIGSLGVLTAVLPLFIDSGFGRALINRKEVSQTEYSSVFFFNVGVSVFLYLLVFILIPYIADLFHTSQNVIVPVARVMFLGLIINALGLIHRTILIKKADFKGITKVNLAALTIANIVAIVMAIKGYGVWALVAQILLLAIFRTLFFWIYSSWKPKIVANLQALKNFFGFSNKLLLSSLISTITYNIYPSIIAVFYPMSQVAYYDRAKRYQDIPFLVLSNTYRSVSMLILSEINDQEERLKRVTSKLMKSISFLSFPIAAILILIAEPTFFLFFKEKWMASVPYFQILTLAGMFSPFILVVNELFVAKEKSKFLLGMEIAKGAILIVLIFLFIPKGITGLAISWVVYTIIALILSLILSKKLIHYSLADFSRDSLPYLFISLLSMALGYAATLKIDNDLLFILIGITVVGVSYLLICKLLKLEMTKEIDSWLLKKKLK